MADDSKFCNYAQLIADVYQQGKYWNIGEWGVETVIDLFDAISDEQVGTLDKSLRLRVCSKPYATSCSPQHWS